MGTGTALMLAEAGTTMTDFITKFESTWNSAAMWGELSSAGALIGSVVVFAFGYYVVRRVVKGVSKGKAKI